MLKYSDDERLEYFGICFETADFLQIGILEPLPAWFCEHFRKKVSFFLYGLKRIRTKTNGTKNFEKGRG